jgi:hypothetical protein
MGWWKKEQTLQEQLEAGLENTVIVSVARKSPDKWNGVPISGAIDDYEVQTMEELRSQVRKQAGGGSYLCRVRRKDDRGRLVFMGCFQLNLPGEPLCDGAPIEPHTTEAKEKKTMQKEQENEDMPPEVTEAEKAAKVEEARLKVEEARARRLLRLKEYEKQGLNLGNEASENDSDNNVLLSELQALRMEIADLRERAKKDEAVEYMKLLADIQARNSQATIALLEKQLEMTQQEKNNINTAQLELFKKGLELGTAVSQGKVLDEEPTDAMSGIMKQVDKFTDVFREAIMLRLKQATATKPQLSAEDVPRLVSEAVEKVRQELPFKRSLPVPQPQTSPSQPPPPPPPRVVAEPAPTSSASAPAPAQPAQSPQATAVNRFLQILIREMRAGRMQEESDVAALAQRELPADVQMELLEVIPSGGQAVLKVLEKYGNKSLVRRAYHLAQSIEKAKAEKAAEKPAEEQNNATSSADVTEA